MKRKITKKLNFKKSTIVNLDDREQKSIRGGEETIPGCITGMTFCTCPSGCGSCVTNEPYICPTVVEPTCLDCETYYC